LLPHAAERIIERGASVDEVVATVEGGERFNAKFGRQGFRRDFAFGSVWRGKWYATKQIKAYAVDESGWLVITVIVKFFEAVQRRSK